jgi:hypothetical protein
MLIGLAVSMLLTLIGALFKIQSWEGGGIFISLGVISFPLVIIGFAIYKIIEAQKSKRKLDLRDLPRQEKEHMVLENNDDLIV